MIFLTNLTILTIFSPIGALESKCLSVGSSVCLSTLLIFLLYKSFVIYFDILWYVNMYYDICQLISLSIQRTWTFSWSIFTIFLLFLTIFAIFSFLNIFLAPSELFIFKCRSVGMCGDTFDLYIYWMIYYYCLCL